MNPEIWGNLPSDLIERIAHFADIDSRRALGFLPRKIIPPDLDLHVVDFAKSVRLDKKQCGPQGAWFHEVMGKDGLSPIDELFESFDI